MKLHTIAVLMFGFSFLGCDWGSGDAKPTAETQKGVAPPTTGATVQGQGVTQQPNAAQGYSLSAIKTIADECGTPHVLLASAPKSVGDNYAWNVSRQALLANQQFTVVSGAPSAPGQVSLATYVYNDNAYALVASCKDGGTCNQLAAM